MPCGSRCRRPGPGRTSTRPATTRARARAPALPPMGLRLRLKASVDISGYGPQSRVILTALKRYGMILADNGTGYYISGAPDPALGRRRAARARRRSRARCSRSSTPPASSTASRARRIGERARSGGPRVRRAGARCSGRARATAARGRSSSPGRGPAARRRSAPARPAAPSDSTIASAEPPGRSTRPQPPANSVSPLKRRPSSVDWRQTEPGVWPGVWRTRRRICAEPDLAAFGELDRRDGRRDLERRAERLRVDERSPVERVDGDLGAGRGRRPPRCRRCDPSGHESRRSASASSRGPRARSAIQASDGIAVSIAIASRERSSARMWTFVEAGPTTREIRSINPSPALFARRAVVGLDEQSAARTRTPRHRPGGSSPRRGRPPIRRGRARRTARSRLPGHAGAASSDR